MFSKSVLTSVLAALAVTADAAVINRADNNTAPVAQTKAGLVRGGLCPKSTTKHFQGIPYAKPPVNELRFMAPQDFDGKFPADGLDATKIPPPCVQFPPEFFDVPSPEASEDCLYLDVYAPASAKPGSNLPVKVWAYGGGNEGGAISLPLYDGCNSADDAVLVSFNYRLGPLGFLALEDAGIEGNMAIKDYVKALEWVQANIASFGGDASQVMLFGQSAGASDAFVVSALPQAKSLMKSVAMQSGGGQDLAERHLADAVGASYAETLGCSRSDLKCLQSKTHDELMKAIPNTPALANNTVATSIYGIDIPNVADLASPMLDGKFVKEQPLSVGSQVPVIVGSTGMDGSLLTLPYLFDFIDKGLLNEKNYTDFLASFGPAADAVGKQYPLSRFNESGQIGITVATAITYITTMSAFQCPANKVLRAATYAGTAAYAYRWDLTPTCPWLFNDNAPFPTGDSRDIFGATHSAEIPYVFGNTDNMPYGVGNCSLSAAEKDISKKLKGAWTAMAANGSPVTKDQAWSKFNACDNNGLHVTKDNTLVVGKLDFDECPFWDEIVEQLGGLHVPRPSKGSCKGSPCKPKHH